MLGARCHDCGLRGADQFQNDPSLDPSYRHRSVPLSASQCSGFRRGHIGFCGGGIYFALSPQAQHQCMMKRNQKDHRNSFPSFLILRESVDHIFLSEHVSADCIRVDPFMNPYRLTPMKNLMAVHIVKAMFFLQRPFSGVQYALRIFEAEKHQCSMSESIAMDKPEELRKKELKST